ncbi:MAG: hypothetical protein H6738_20635 [Alphaproteobacteria bacterium]|nr:hypothetical protein [Alphaproteobacteria bacterium]MCB9699199.1 hypothetical protein [Alphaproteobacteria bacterium]
MRRWHLTLFLAILAAAGVALATTLQVRRMATPAEPQVQVIGPRHQAPTEVVEVLEVTPVEQVPEVAPPPHVQPRPTPPERPVVPVRPPRHLELGVHPIHVDDGELAPNAIPELNEPRQKPILQQLPPDEPPGIGDGCPACGMG